MRRVFRRSIERLGLANVTVLQADACDMREVVAASVDVVYSVACWRPSPITTG